MLVTCLLKNLFIIYFRGQDKGDIYRPLSTFYILLYIPILIKFNKLVGLLYFVLLQY